MVSSDQSNPCLIVDIGAKNCRIGTSTFEKPLMECLSFEKKDIYSIQEMGSLICNSYFEPILQRGIITNWSFVEKQIKIFLHQHRIEPFKTCVIFSQSIASSDDDKEKGMHVLFENIGFHSICTPSDAFLSFVASGKLTGIIIQIGHSITEIIPVINGDPLLQYAEYFNVAGFDISSKLSSEINQYSFPTSSNLSLKRDEFKEEMCYIPKNVTKELSKFNKSQPPPILLSRQSVTGNAFKRFEEQKLHNSARICFEIAEIWFQNDFAKIICDIISKMPFQYQDTLYSNIILSGGTVQMKGFKERFVEEMSKKLPTGTSFNVSIANPANPSLAAFQGAVILSKTGNFTNLLTKRDQYSPEKFKRNQLIRTSKRIKNASLLLSS